MKTNRRKFISASIAGGLAATALPVTSCGKRFNATNEESERKLKDDRLGEIIKEPVLKKELFKTPVIIESLELLKYENRYLCRVRSTDGAEGISVAHSGMSTFFPIFVKRVQPG